MNLVMMPRTLVLLLALATCAAALGEVSASVSASVEGRLTTGAPRRPGSVPALRRLALTARRRAPAELPLDSVRVVLNGGTYTAIPRQDGIFKFHAIAPGTYLLEVLDTQSVWPTVRLDVSAKAAGKARALLTHSRQPLPFPLPLEPLVAKPAFFEKREGFQWKGMLMNPMVIMMGVTLLIMVVFPKMMANMDPEELKQMQQMQGGITDMLNPDKLKEKQAALQEKKREKGGKKDRD